MCDVPISQGDLEPKGHNQHCPLAQCESCKLTGHITDVCTFRQCCDVEIHYLNLLLLTKARNTIESYFDATDQASVQPNALHIDGKFSESTDWNHVQQRFAISDRQVLELKSVAHEFKRATTREYERAQRDVNHPSNAPIHFVFPESQMDPNGTARSSSSGRLPSRPRGLRLQLRRTAPPTRSRRSSSAPIFRTADKCA